jgi:hypothetical protein
MIRASRRRWFLLACTSLATGSAACGQTVDTPEEKLGSSKQAIANLICSRVSGLIETIHSHEQGWNAGRRPVFTHAGDPELARCVGSDNGAPPRTRENSGSALGPNS